MFNIVRKALKRRSSQSVYLGVMNNIVSFLVLLLKGLVLISVPGEATVYYVTPTDPPTSNCPVNDSVSCHTLNYYFTNGFSGSHDDGNVTMILLPGSHVYTGSDGDFLGNLEIFKMIGLEQANNTVVCMKGVLEIDLDRVSMIYIGMLTFTMIQYGMVSIIGNLNSKQTSEVSLISVVFNGAHIMEEGGKSECASGKLNLQKSVYFWC